MYAGASESSNANTSFANKWHTHSGTGACAPLLVSPAPSAAAAATAPSLAASPSPRARARAAATYAAAASGAAEGAFERAPQLHQQQQQQPRPEPEAQPTERASASRRANAQASQSLPYGYSQHPSPCVQQPQPQSPAAVPPFLLPMSFALPLPLPLLSPSVPTAPPLHQRQHQHHKHNHSHCVHSQQEQKAWHPQPHPMAQTSQAQHWGQPQPAFISGPTPSQVLQQISSSTLAHSLLAHQLAQSPSLYAFPPLLLPPLSGAAQPVPVPVGMQNYSHIVQTSTCTHVMQWPHVWNGAAAAAAAANPLTTASATSMQLQPSLLVPHWPRAINSTASLFFTQDPSASAVVSSTNETGCANAANSEQCSPAGSGSNEERNQTSNRKSLSNEAEASAQQRQTRRSSIVTAGNRTRETDSPHSGSVAGAAGSRSCFKMEVSPIDTLSKNDPEGGSNASAPTPADRLECLSVLVPPLPPPPPVWPDLTQMPPRMRRQLEQCASARRESPAFVLDAGNPLSATDRAELERMMRFQERFEAERRELALQAQDAANSSSSSHSHSLAPASIPKRSSSANLLIAVRRQSTSSAGKKERERETDYHSRDKRDSSPPEPAEDMHPHGAAEHKSEPEPVSNEARCDAEWSRIGRERGVPTSLLPLSLPLHASQA